MVAEFAVAEPDTDAALESSTKALNCGQVTVWAFVDPITADSDRLVIGKLTDDPEKVPFRTGPEKKSWAFLIS